MAHATKNTYGSGGGAGQLTYGSGHTYADHSRAIVGFIALVDDAVTREPNKVSVKITFTGSKLFVIHSVTPVVNVSSFIFAGHEAFADRSTGEYVGVRVKHAGSDFRIDEIRLQGNLRKREQPASE